MHLSKKKKTLFAWTIPAVAAVVASAIVVPIVILKENDKNKDFNKTPDYIPEFFFDFDSSMIYQPTFIPSDYDLNFFLYKILQSPKLINEVFTFELDGLEFDKNLGVWKSDSGITYQITKVEPVLDGNDELIVEADNYSFDLFITKKSSSKSKEYKVNVKVPIDAFASKEESMKNFVANTSAVINDLFATQELKFISTNESYTSVTDIKSADDLDINSNVSDVENKFIKQTNSQNNEVYYSSTGQKFSYLTSSNVIKLITPINEGGTSLVLNSEEAYNFNSDGSFNTSGSLFTFLKQAYDDKNLLYLPELSEDELNKITIDGNVDEDKKLEMQIQKLIFDPEKISYSIKDGNKVPLSDYQAVVVKVQLGDTFTYIVTWSNIFSISSSVVQSAPELSMKVLLKNGIQLTSTQMKDKSNFSLIVPTENPTNNLIYEVIEVSFEDENETIAKVKVRITHSLLSKDESKEYETEISTGFKSKPYVDMEEKINNKLGSNPTSLNALTPTVPSYTEAQKTEIFNNMYNMDKLKELLNLTAPSGLSGIEYTPDVAILDGNNLIIQLKISPEKDPKAYWTNNGSSPQTVAITINNVVPQTS